MVVYEFVLQVLTGKVKGRKLKVPRGRTIRPTTSRVKKVIFDTLGDISDFEVLDLFAGSGSLGIEALSRGASEVTFVEKNPSVCRVLRENLTLCGFLDRATVICSDYGLALKRLKRSAKSFDLVFIDPPYSLYEKKSVSELVREAEGVLRKDGIIVIEHNYRLEDKDTPEGFTRVTKPFGGTQLSFFRRADR
ncbi:MAG: methyltransferase [Deltaproteobacteria bacterium]|jgi:16S rRNA (guanine966-N2)-methyltransferase|nr:MAG: methyltransferase [Deltaproteobacteria bacterium]